MNIKQRNRLFVTLFSLLLSGYLPPGTAGELSPLDIEQHPGSPSYESLFPDQVLPLDTRLSWKRRFLGGESFNSDESLPSTSPVLEQLLKNPDSRTSPSSSGDAGPVGFDTTGIVQQVKVSEGKIKIKHGPIERLGMPAMTMMFRVEDPSQLTGLEKGAEVNFNVDNTAAGFSITQLQTEGGDSGRSFDARGTIKSIRASQSKVKIEHGPIERLGMPGMTMIFKIKNPEDLNALERDMQIDFDVINGPGGFEIIRIRPLAE